MVVMLKVKGSYLLSYGILVHLPIIGGTYNTFIGHPGPLVPEPQAPRSGRRLRRDRHLQLGDFFGVPRKITVQWAISWEKRGESQWEKTWESHGKTWESQWEKHGKNIGKSVGKKHAETQ